MQAAASERFVRPLLDAAREQRRLCGADSRRPLTTALRMRAKPRRAHVVAAAGGAPYRGGC